MMLKHFFIFFIFSRRFSLSLPLPYWSFIVCVLKRLFPFVDSKWPRSACSWYNLNLARPNIKEKACAHHFSLSLQNNPISFFNMIFVCTVASYMIDNFFFSNYFDLKKIINELDQISKSSLSRLAATSLAFVELLQWFSRRLYYNFFFVVLIAIVLLTVLAPKSNPILSFSSLM